MKIRLGPISLATGALVLAAASGCASDPGTPSASEASSHTSAVGGGSPPSTPSTAAAADASAALRRYFSGLDRVRRRSAIPLSALTKVATSTQLTAEERLVRAERAQGLHQTGETRLRVLTVQSVDLSNADPNAGQVPTVVIDVCWDVSNADLVNRNGTSAVAPSRPPRGWTRYSVSNYAWTAHPTDGWRVASGEDLERQPCSSS